MVMEKSGSWHKGKDTRNLNYLNNSFSSISNMFYEIKLT